MRKCFGCNTYAQFVSVASKGLRGLHNCRRSWFSSDEPGLRMLCWGADLTTEKRRQAAVLQSVRSSRERGRNCGENCGGGICDPGMKKAAEQLPQLEKARTLTRKVRYQMTHSESRTFG